MKLKTEQEIESLGYKIQDHPVTNHAFTQGYMQAQQDLLSQASEGFEEWWNSVIRPIAGVGEKQSCKEAWQAAKLSQAKEIEALQKENEELKQELLFSKPLYSRRKLEERIKEADEIIISWNQYLKKENELASKIGTVADDYIAKWIKGNANALSGEEAKLKKKLIEHEQ